MTNAGGWEFGIATTYKTYQAASLEWERDVQYSSMEAMLSLAASKHRNTAKPSLLDADASLPYGEGLSAHLTRNGRYMTILRLRYRHCEMPAPRACGDPAGGKTV